MSDSKDCRSPVWLATTRMRIPTPSVSFRHHRRRSVSAEHSSSAESSKSSSGDDNSQLDLKSSAWPGAEESVYANALANDLIGYCAKSRLDRELLCGIVAPTPQMQQKQRDKRRDPALARVRLHQGRDRGDLEDSSQQLSWRIQLEQ